MRTLVGVLLFVASVGAPRAAFASKAARHVDAAAHRMIVGDYAGAEPLLRQALAEDPGNPWAHYNMGAVLRALGHYDEAVREYRRALDLFPPGIIPARGQTLYGIALAQDDKGDASAAIAAWNDYLRFAGKRPSESGAVAIAHLRLDAQMRVAQAKGIPPFGPPTATRPSARP
jgi:tetratricopeptide (TPR) repeat protein